MDRETFTNSIDKMQNLYHDTERQFIELSYIIPLDNNEKTYSPRLYNIFQSTCGQVLNMLKIICDRLNLQYKNDNFPTLYTILNNKRLLEKQNSVIVSLKKEIFPFKTEENTMPSWWTKYNNTKHKLPDGLYEGNIGNVINALSALYILHRMAFYASSQIPSEFLDSNKWSEPIKIDPKMISMHIKGGPTQPFYSELFYGGTYYGGTYS